MRFFQASKPRPKEEHPGNYSIVSPSPFAVCETCQVVYEVERGHVCTVKSFLLSRVRNSRLQIVVRR